MDRIRRFLWVIISCAFFSGFVYSAILFYWWYKEMEFCSEIQSSDILDGTNVSFCHLLAGSRGERNYMIVSGKYSGRKEVLVSQLVSLYDSYHEENYMDKSNRGAGTLNSEWVLSDIESKYGEEINFDHENVTQSFLLVGINVLREDFLFLGKQSDFIFVSHEPFLWEKQN